MTSFIFYIFITFLFLSGLLVNITPIQIRSVYIDIPYFLLFLLTFLKIIMSLKVKKLIWKPFVVYIVFILFAFTLFLINENNLFVRIVGMKNFPYYLFIIFIIFILFHNFHICKLEKMFNYLFFWIFIISGLGILQAVFHMYLPDELLFIKGTHLLNFYGNDSIFRPTGLIGNSLEFGGLVLIAFVLSYSKFVVTQNMKTFLLVILSVTSIFLSYSRASFILMFIAMILIHTIYYLSYQRLGKIALISIIILLFSSIIMYLFSDNMFILQRLFSPDINTLKSNVEHMDDILNALNTIDKNPIFGVGIGSQGVSSHIKIITDGFWFQLFLEYGIPLGFIYITYIIIIILIIYLKKDIPKKYFFLISSSITLILVFHMASLSNSSYLAPINLMIIWMIIAFTFIIIYKNERIKYVRR